MARLNEPPIAPQPSAETIDAGEATSKNERRIRIDEVDIVKRRFSRQNRELAKYAYMGQGYGQNLMHRRINSNQSIRIRSLENDCSRLLAENLSLREQVLQLQNTLESHSSRPSFENIDAVKSQLEAKMLELGGLVAELGQLKKEDARPRCKSQLEATRRTPDEREWRIELQKVADAMLPTVAEGKYYPRRTMGYVDITLSEGD
jgi:hypothetical protein